MLRVSPIHIFCLPSLSYYSPSLLHSPVCHSPSSFPHTWFPLYLFILSAFKFHISVCSVSELISWAYDIVKPEICLRYLRHHLPDYDSCLPFLFWFYRVWFLFFFLCFVFGLWFFLIPMCLSLHLCFFGFDFGLFDHSACLTIWILCISDYLACDLGLNKGFLIIIFWYASGPLDETSQMYYTVNIVYFICPCRYSTESGGKNIQIKK